MSDFDRQYYFSLLYSDPVAANDYMLEHSQKVNQFMNEYETKVRPSAELAMRNAVNAAVVSRHPELINGVPEDRDIQNGEVIAKYLEEQNMAYTVENVEAALDAKKRSGELVLGSPGITVRDDKGQFVSENHFVSTAPLEKVEQYYRNKHPDRQR